MKKIIVIGCPGSGKSYFSKALHKLTGIELYHLDMLYWNADKTTVSCDVFQERLFRVLEKDAWILDGNYASTMEIRLATCDTVFFLDFPQSVCLDGVQERMGKPRSDMPWIETEEDEAFIKFIKSFHQHQRPKILSLLEQYGNKTVITFTSRKEAEDFLVRAQTISNLYSV